MDSGTALGGARFNFVHESGSEKPFVSRLTRTYSLVFMPFLFFLFCYSDTDSLIDQNLGCEVKNKV